MPPGGPPTQSDEKKIKKFKLPEELLKKNTPVHEAYVAWREAGKIWGDLTKRKATPDSRGTLDESYAALCELLEPVLKKKGWIPDDKYLQFDHYRNAEGQADGIQWWVADEPKKGLGLQVLDPF
jgi:hypothetical protein